MNSDEIIINLKVLEGLEKNKKLITRGSYLNKEPVSIIPEFIRRWNRQDNRDETIKKINLIVNSAIKIINNKKDNNKSEVKLDIEKYLKNSINGINNLKDTYSTCIQTCSRLDVIIDNIKTTLNIKDDCEEYYNNINNYNDINDINDINNNLNINDI